MLKSEKIAKQALLGNKKFQIKIQSSTDAKTFFNEVHGNMNRYKAHTQSRTSDGVAIYPKGYEQHMSQKDGMVILHTLNDIIMELMVIFFTI